MAAPEGASKPEELLQLFDLLLGSGMDIATMNLIRKRFTRWGAGRLAAALKPARVRNFIISNVIGNDLAAIGSGPCSPDPSTAGEIRSLLHSSKLWDRIPGSMRQYLTLVDRDQSLETPKAGNDAFENVERKIIASNRVALEAAAARAKELGYDPRILSTSLAGEASRVGKQLASTLISYCGSGASPLTNRPVQSCLLWGGETTVTLNGANGVGGRCQELALAAARELAHGKERAGRYAPRVRHRRSRRPHGRGRRHRRQGDVGRHRARRGATPSVISRRTIRMHRSMRPARCCARISPRPT